MSVMVVVCPRAAIREMTSDLAALRSRLVDTAAGFGTLVGNQLSEFNG